MIQEITEQDESDLILAAREGDLTAFSELVRRNQGGIRACLVVRLRQVHEAEDLAQEAFMTAYRKMSEFREGAAFGPWVRGIALNLLKNHLRKHKPLAMGGAAELEGLIDKQMESDTVSSEENEPLLDSLAALKCCMGKLPDQLKVLIAQHYQHGVSVQELTKQEGVKHSTMTMRLHRTRQKLKECIQSQLQMTAS